MPRPDSPPIAKRAREPSSNANDWAKRARCVVGSPASMLMNQMIMSPTVRSPSTRLSLLDLLQHKIHVVQHEYVAFYPSCR
jgi:hypothetical protein